MNRLHYERDLHNILFSEKSLSTKFASFRTTANSLPVLSKCPEAGKLLCTNFADVHLHVFVFNGPLQTNFGAKGTLYRVVRFLLVPVQLLDGGHFDRTLRTLDGFWKVFGSDVDVHSLL